jgi:hypothetical protein
MLCYVIFCIILVQLCGNKCCTCVCYLWLMSEECGVLVSVFYLIVIGAYASRFPQYLE